MNHRPVQFREGLTESTAQPSFTDLRKLQALFQEAAFWAKDRQIADLEVAIAHSNPVISVWDGTELIGFARATSDGVYRATIWDVVIHPAYRGVGLGRKLVQTLLAHPHLHKVERVYLMTTHQQRFYEQIGFECNPSSTMVLHQGATPSPVGALAPEMIQVRP